MEVKKYNVSKPKKYTDKSGEEKTKWDNIGVMTEFHKDDGSISRIMEIPAIGLEGNIFPFEDRKDKVDMLADKVGGEEVKEDTSDAPF